MAIIVEDGTSVAGANSYAGLATVRAYALARGIVLSADDAVLEPQVINAMDFLESFSLRFMGTRLVYQQVLSWPRYGVYINDFYYPSRTLPPQLIDAVSAVVMEIHSGVDPFNPPLLASPVIRERVEGAVDVRYSDPGNQAPVTKTRPSMRLINQLLGAGGGSVFAVRA